MTVIPRSALRYMTTPRLSHLARHKPCPTLPIKPCSEWDWSQWESDVTAAALSAQASARVTELAQTKTEHPLYLPCRLDTHTIHTLAFSFYTHTPLTLTCAHTHREVQWPVTAGARAHTASELTVKLAQPKARNSEDFDPRAWTVSRAALHAQPSPRLAELATPLPRKCRQRKS